MSMNLKDMATLFLFFCLNILSPLNAQTIHEFTNSGAYGRYGPTQSQVNNAYSGTSLAGLITINTQGIQEWTVSSTGTYTIDAWGASADGTRKGKGARIKGEFDLSSGDVIKILVGQQGILYNNNNSFRKKFTYLF